MGFEFVVILTFKVLSLILSMHPVRTREVRISCLNQISNTEHVFLQRIFIIVFSSFVQRIFQCFSQFLRPVFIHFADSKEVNCCTLPLRRRFCLASKAKIRFFRQEHGIFPVRLDFLSDFTYNNGQSKAIRKRSTCSPGVRDRAVGASSAMGAAKVASVLRR